MRRASFLWIPVVAAGMACGGKDAIGPDGLPPVYRFAITEYHAPLTVLRSDGAEIGRTSCDGANCFPLGPRLSADGSVVAFTGFPDTSSALFIANTNGTGEREIARVPRKLIGDSRLGVTYSRPYFWPEWSSDGRLVYVRDGSAIEAVNANGTGGRVIAIGSGLSHPHWSPDNSTITVQSGTSTLYAYSANDGSGPRQIFTSTDQIADHAWSPDGSSIAVQTNSTVNGLTSPLVRIDPRTLTKTTIVERSDGNFCWSPDSRSIAYLALDTSPGAASQRNIYIVNASGGAPNRLVGIFGFLVSGVGWTPDGNAVLFLSPPDTAAGNLGPSSQLLSIRVADRMISRLTSSRQVQYFATERGAACTSMYY